MPSSHESGVRSSDKSLGDIVSDYIIRPPRSKYTLKDLGPVRFRLGDDDATFPAFRRRDVVLYNMRGMKIQCSWYVPDHFYQNPTQHRLWQQKEELRFREFAASSCTMLSTPPPPFALPCVVYCHANCGSRYDGNEAIFLLERHFSIFTFDFCGSGMSDGEYISLGYYEQQDLAAVVEYLQREEEVSAIGLWGRSMGAVTAILYASRDPFIQCIVCDSPFSSLEKLIEEIATQRVTKLVPGFVRRYIVQRIRKNILQRAQFDIHSLNTITDAASKCRVPALLLHGKKDTFVHPHHSLALRDAYAPNVPCWQQMVDGDHNSNRDSSHDLIVSFLRIYLHDKPASRTETEKAWMQEKWQSEAKKKTEESGYIASESVSSPLSFSSQQFKSPPSSPPLSSTSKTNPARESTPSHSSRPSASSRTTSKTERKKAKQKEKDDREARDTEGSSRASDLSAGEMRGAPQRPSVSSLSSPMSSTTNGPPPLIMKARPGSTQSRRSGRPTGERPSMESEKTSPFARSGREGRGGEEGGPPSTLPRFTTPEVVILGGRGSTVPSSSVGGGGEKEKEAFQRTFSPPPTLRYGARTPDSAASLLHIPAPSPSSASASRVGPPETRGEAGGGSSRSGRRCAPHEAPEGQRPPHPHHPHQPLPPPSFSGREVVGAMRSPLGEEAEEGSGGTRLSSSSSSSSLAFRRTATVPSFSTALDRECPASLPAIPILSGAAAVSSRATTPPPPSSPPAPRPSGGAVHLFRPRPSHPLPIDSTPPPHATATAASGLTFLPTQEGSGRHRMERWPIGAGTPPPSGGAVPLGTTAFPSSSMGSASTRLPPLSEEGVVCHSRPKRGGTLSTSPPAAHEKGGNGRRGGGEEERGENGMGRPHPERANGDESEARPPLQETYRPFPAVVPVHLASREGLERQSDGRRRTSSLPPTRHSLRPRSSSPSSSFPSSRYAASPSEEAMAEVVPSLVSELQASQKTILFSRPKLLPS